MAKALITVFGGTGFLGRRVVRRALESGWAVRVAARHLRPDLFAGPNQPEQVTADIRDPVAVAGATRSATGVVNCVALYIERRGRRFETIHVVGAGHVARSARLASARLVHLSGIGIDRDSPSGYVRARALGEECVAHVYPGSVILRPSALFGPGDALLSSLTAMIRRLPVIPLFGDGGARIQPVHVDDVARGAVAALMRDDAPGGTFELGGPDVYSYRGLIEALAARLRRRPRLVPVSFDLWRMVAAALSLFPSPPVTRDQIELVRRDNVVGGGKTFENLGIDPGSLTRILDVVADVPGKQRR